MVYQLPNVESFYTGTYTTAPSESYGELFTGYRINFSRIGSPTSMQTANQISEVTARLSEGTKIVELQPLQGEIFDTIPAQQFTEVKQLMKLTGAEPTLHAPLIDPAGFTEGGIWTEANRQEAEREMFNAVQRAHQMDAKGNIPVTFHATGARGIPSFDPIPGPGNKKEILYIVDRESGQMGPIKREITALPAPVYEFDENGFVKKDEKGNPIEDKRVVSLGKGLYEVPPEVALDEFNRRHWSKPLTDIEYNKNYVESHLSEYVSKIIELDKERQIRGLRPEEKQILNQLVMQVRTIKNIGQDTELNLKERFTHAFNAANENDKKILQKAAENYSKQLRKIGAPDFEKLIEENPAEFVRIVKLKSNAETDFINDLRKVNPRQYIPTEEFALDKTKQTIGNIALKAYKQFGDKAPIISIENVMPNTVFARADSMKKLVEESRKVFVENAKKEGMSESEAKEAAKRLIGVTWDTGHINLIRKYGFGEKDGVFNKEEFGKFIAEETKKIAPYVKHVHLADNFGYNETHLPPGMGEVPFKEILRELEKAGYKGKNIIEAGNFVAHKMGSPTPYVLEAFGSPIYGAQAQPYWNQARASYGFPQGYFGGYGMMLPEQHFSTYGSGFSSLPQELGGQMPGKGQRFSGSPME